MSTKSPLRILCQTADAGCAACCGSHNFRDRSHAAQARRFARRTALVRAAGFDVTALAAARDVLLAEERPEILSPGIPVCPFAGFLDEAPAPAEGGASGGVDDGPGGDATRRVGCMIHPLRHPEGEDLRDLAVYPRAVCAGHFCAPHDWLKPREADLAATACGLRYGEVVTNAALLKALTALLEDALGRPLTRDTLQHVAPSRWAMAWDALRAGLGAPDADPLRFGPVRLRPAPVLVDEASETGTDVAVAPAPPDELRAPPVFTDEAPAHSRAEAQLLHAVGVRPLDRTEAEAVLARLRALVAELAAAIARIDADTDGTAPARHPAVDPPARH